MEEALEALGIDVVHEVHEGQVLALVRAQEAAILKRYLRLESDNFLLTELRAELGHHFRLLRCSLLRLLLLCPLLSPPFCKGVVRIHCVPEDCLSMEQVFIMLCLLQTLYF